MLRTTVLDRPTRSFRELSSPTEIAAARARPGAIVWVDVTDPGEADFAWLAREFGFHPLSVEDCRNRHQRPKVEEYAGYYFLVLYEVTRTEEEGLRLSELAVFLGSNYLVTVHTEPLRAIEAAGRLWREWADVAERGTGLLAYLIADSVVDEYLPLLDALSDRLEGVEEKIFERFEASAVEDLFELKKELLLLRRVVTPLRDVFNVLLRREQPLFSRETHVYFQDVFDHLIRVADAIDSLREMVGSTMDAYLSVSNNRMNEVMKRLTGIATILMSVTLIASVFGMNFRFMPELDWRYGYVGALATMLVVGISLYMYFRRSRWL